MYWRRIGGGFSKNICGTCFADDPERFDGFSANLDDLLIDFSKERIDADALTHLLDLARSVDVEGNRTAMFCG